MKSTTEAAQGSTLWLYQLLNNVYVMNSEPTLTFIKLAMPVSLTSMGTDSITSQIIQLVLLEICNVVFAISFANPVTNIGT